MSDIAIQVEGLAKRFQLGELGGAAYDTLRDRFAGALAAPFRRASSVAGRSHRATAVSQLAELWALEDVSFDVRHGEVVGIIGRNGAGKSTLLKILSRITEPTKGEVRLYGRVGSLLEVGTGFHPELTGRENIFLNGAILGMARTEISRKLDEIIDFAEVERFIDTPVKNYSSGMYLRLAFAVAAHLEPEILIVDEVLAVGDAAFQKKCLNKMEDVGHQGRTVLFVSHNMQAVTRLCDRTIMLEAGRVKLDGPSHKVVGAYMNAGVETQAVREWNDAARAPGGNVARLRAVRVRSADGQISDAIDIRRPVAVEMEFDVLDSGHVLLPHFHFANEAGVHVFSAHDTDPEWRQRRRPAGRYISTACIPGNFLTEGTIYVEAAIVTLNPVTVQFTERDAVAFRVLDSLDTDTARGDWAGEMYGVVRPLLDWTTDFSSGKYQRVGDAVEEAVR